MPSDNELKIILSLVDNASAKLKEALGESEKGAKKLGDEGDKAGKKTEDSFKKSTSQLRQFKSQVGLAIGVITSLVYTTREYAKYNDEARASVNEFDLSMQKLSVNAGKALMPVLNLLNQAAKGWTMIADLIANVSSGEGFVLSGDTGEDATITAIITAKQHLRDFNEEQANTKVLYQDGQITAEEYYASLTNNESNLQMVRSNGMAQMRELANLTMEINNQDLMQAQRMTSEKIALLNYYKDNYNQAHSGMAAFTVMFAQSVKQNLSAAFTDMIMRAKTAKEAFAALGQAMVQAIVEFMVQKVISWALEKTLLAGTVAANSAAAATLAAAWAPAALAASLATAGANATGAIAGIASTAAALASSMATVGAVGKGGAVDLGTIHVTKSASQFSDGTDTVPSMLSPGEMVVPRTFAQAIREGELTLGGRGGGDGSQNISIEINNPILNSMDNINQLVEEISYRLSRETERG